MAATEYVITLNDGHKMPQIGFGTWNCATGEVGQVVKVAVDAGYRHFDCAFVYGNEKEIGDSLKEIFASGKVKREDLFIVTKLWCTGHRPEHVRDHCVESMKRLGLDYLDMYLIHWPYAYEARTHPNISELFPKNAKGDTIYEDIHPLETWKAMEKLVDEGLCRSIGVSNFNSVQIKELVEKAKIKPAVNQIEVNPYNSNYKLVKLCQSLGVAVTAYSPFASPQRPWGAPGEPVIFDEPKMAALAKKYKKTMGQVILRWLIQRDIIVIPKSVKEERIRQNLDVKDFELSEDDMAFVDSFNKDLKLVMPMGEKDGKRVPMDGDAPHFPFHIPY